ncbi:hypothetical protein GA417_07610 [Poseidonibacter ostreae]|uniref:hypothetical protein n=1 Tax=Poseidonibacter ostreae TaxID=2654171 RepID=UPI001264F17D|nr:hypothetical protein [Poseidonibacter ostreae]KAB7885640.1 hypothetical protein GA417_07610 [Poseidonibacter ostreae]
MHTLKINVEDNVYTHLKFFLESLNNKGIEVIEDKILENDISKRNFLFNAISIDTTNFKFSREEANER